MEIKACIFDLDGVLCDTAKYHYLAWKRLAGELGFSFTEAQNERLKGVSRMDSLEILLEIGHVKCTQKAKEEMAEKKNRWYVEYINKMDQSELLPGVLDFLEECRENGLRTALGSVSKNAGVILERLKLQEYLDAVVDGSQVSQAKPDPEVFLKGAKRLGTDPSACVVFEDAAAGIEAARRAGMKSVGIGDPGILCQADYVIPGFEKFHAETLDQWF
ncbi:beta-phosphoglucomutase [Diplocloster agilis]|uniref:beta-phosphoglucomutase n=1 Tax=Diplocloster agilis TaxID=2850323 RepID=UPI000822F54D|nr:beta-phosphoglucomutase [Suonthocola fibrivorans]MCU6733302.1 beta-phosphoglucomutase [Suonthocola fibrivorans]SCI86387.1 Beta-phosphoglucomutase [uncultured Clostridium sp.]